MGKMLAVLAVGLFVTLVFAAFGDTRPTPLARIAVMDRIDRVVSTAGQQSSDIGLPDRMEVGSIMSGRPGG